ncbi:hypothetical protein BV20DRAFT_560327 [Pilatotrama ljubarskyi]|nr:hypothetical protein BV20DRAFT_560327 [Pilatotrama ljubarskyi]
MVDIRALPYDVLLKICESLRQEESWEGMKALSSLARTCRFLSQPALDGLWRVLPSIVPLLRTLPEDVLHFTPERRNRAGNIILAASVRLSRPPLSAAFKRFRFYSPRVRKIEVPTHPTRLHFLADRYVLHRANLPKSVLQTLSRYWPLLPNMRSLEHCEPLLYKNGDGPLEPVEPLLQPSLSAVSLVVRPERAAHVLRTMRLLSASITTLKLTVATPYSRAHAPQEPHLDEDEGAHWERVATLPRIYTLESSDLQGLNDLTELTLCGIFLSFGALEHLGGLPSLRLLEFDIQCDDIMDAPHGKRGQLFPSLVALTVHTNRLDWCGVFVETISSPSLAEIVLINVGRRAPELLLHALCKVMSEGPWSEALRRVEIEYGYDADDEGRRRSEVNDPVEALSPLFALSALRRRPVSGRCNFPPEDDVFEKLLAEWPGLRRLELCDASDECEGVDSRSDT